MRTPKASKIELLRSATVQRRLHLAPSLTATVVGTARRALARSYPELTPLELDLKFVEVPYGTDLAAELREHLRLRRGGR